eukprot:1625291-Rhodomonas_salina.1
MASGVVARGAGVAREEKRGAGSIAAGVRCLLAPAPTLPPVQHYAPRPSPIWGMGGLPDISGGGSLI